MKNDSITSDLPITRRICEMCGAGDQDRWQTDSARKASFLLRPRSGDPEWDWLLCDECDEGLAGLERNENLPKIGRDTFSTLVWRSARLEHNEGLQNAGLPKPDRIHLLAQVRRATRDDQKALLYWLLGKFGLQATEKE